VIPNSVTNIEMQAFYGCLNLAGVSLGNGLKTIGANAYFYCASLDNLAFPASLTSLGQYSFGACQTLSSVCFAGNQPTDGGSVFYEDSSLSTILVLNGTTGWGSKYDGIATAPCTSCGLGAPELGILLSGTNVLVGWSTSYSGFTLQSTTNLSLPVIWSTVSPPPFIVGTLYAVTNPIAGSKKFYRLSQ
jgi:BspA type Leucine rich repeat region (6 copies)